VLSYEEKWGRVHISRKGDQAHLHNYFCCRGRRESLRGHSANPSANCHLAQPARSSKEGLSPAAGARRRLRGIPHSPCVRAVGNILSQESAHRSHCVSAARGSGAAQTDLRGYEEEPPGSRTRRARTLSRHRWVQTNRAAATGIDDARTTSHGSMHKPPTRRTSGQGVAIRRRGRTCSRTPCRLPFSGSRGLFLRSPCYTIRGGSSLGAMAEPPENSRLDNRKLLEDAGRTGT
jgi:hypothetical protein